MSTNYDQFFGGDLHYNANPGIFNHRGMGNCTDFADKARSCGRILMTFLRGGSLTNNKPFDFGADLDHDLDP